MRNSVFMVWSCVQAVGSVLSRCVSDLDRRRTPQNTTVAMANVSHFYTHGRSFYRRFVSNFSTHIFMWLTEARRWISPSSTVLTIITTKYI